MIGRRAWLTLVLALAAFGGVAGNTFVTAITISNEGASPRALWAGAAAGALLGALAGLVCAGVGMLIYGPERSVHTPPPTEFPPEEPDDPVAR
jgi:hypothetical protein